LPEGATGLVQVLKVTSSDSSIASSNTEPLKRLDLNVDLKLSREECTVYYLRFYNDSSTWIVVLPPFKENGTFLFATSAATAVTKHNHYYSCGKHTYIRQKCQVGVGGGVLNFPLLLQNKFVNLIYFVTG
jgi:hypothetical protein